MLTPLVMLLVAQVEVKVLPVRGGLTAAIEPRAANERFIWLQVPFGGVTPGGGAAFYRLDRRDGGVVPIAAGSTRDRDERFDLPQLPRTWGEDQLIRTTGLVDSLGFHPFPANLEARAATSSRALLAAIDGGALELLELESGARRALDGFIVGRAFAQRDGRFIVHGRTAASAVGTLVVSPDAGLRFLANVTPSGQLSRGVLLTAFNEVVTEAGDRLGDFAIDPAGLPLTVVAAGELLHVTDGSGVTRVLDTRAADVRFDRSRLGRDFVVFERANGPGLIVESLTGRGRFLNTTAPQGLRSSRGGRVRYDDLPLEVFADGGVGPWVDEPCVWRALSDGEYCVGDGGLVTRAQVGDRSTTLAPNLAVPESLPAWDVVSRGVEQPALLFGPGALLHRTDGIDTFSIGPAETILFEAGGRLVVATDGITLIDPATRERTPFGFPVSVRPFPARRSWLAVLPGCRLHELTLDGASREVASVCPTAVIDTPGGAVFITTTQVLWRNPRRATFEPLVFPDETGFAGTVALNSVRGDTGWFTTSGLSTIQVDVPTGNVLRTVVSRTVEVTPLGLLYDSRSGLTWEALDGGTFPVIDESGVPPGAKTKVGAGAVWLVGAQVQVTTGGPPAVLEFVGGRLWANAEPIATSLVQVRDGGFDVLDADGSQRTFELFAFDPATVRRFGERLWFTGWDEAHGFEPWFFDGTTPRLAADVLPGPASSFPQLVGAFDRGVVVQATRADGLNGAVALLLDPPAERLSPLPGAPPAGCGCRAVDATSLLGLALFARFRRRYSVQRSR
ncbi:MAG: hypothetical protein SFW67_27955 [Myxococcaceae bacterium]|nr:hypothetical protein [Myxococcaceae bacterium]